MTHEELNAWKHAQPFRPFKLIMRDGKAYDVPTPEDIFVPPKSEWVYVSDGTGHAHHLFRQWIVEVTPVEQGKGGRRAG